MKILLNAVTATNIGGGVQAKEVNRTYQATVSGTGAVTATVVIDGSNDGANWLEIATITLSGTTTATDGFASDAAWEWVRARCTAVTGAGAAVTALAGGV